MQHTSLLVAPSSLAVVQHQRTQVWVLQLRTVKYQESTKTNTITTSTRNTEVIDMRGITNGRSTAEENEVGAETDMIQDQNIVGMTLRDIVMCHIEEEMMDIFISNLYTTLFCVIIITEVSI